MKHSSLAVPTELEMNKTQFHISSHISVLPLTLLLITSLTLKRFVMGN